MEEKKKKLILLMGELELPWSEKESQEKVDKFSEKEIDILIAICEEMLTYEDSVMEELRESNPEKYEQVQKEYLDKTLELQKKLNSELEENQRIYDDEIADIEEEETLVEKAEEDTQNHPMGVN